MRHLIPSPFFAATCAGALAALVWPLSPPLQPVAPVAAIPVIAHAQPSGTTGLLRPRPELDDVARTRLFTAPLLSDSRLPATYTPPPVPTQESPTDDPAADIAAVPGAMPEPEPAAPPPDLTMLGVIRENRVSRVLLINLSDNTERWYRVGDQIDGWKLLQIGETAAVFVQGNAEFVVKLNR